MSTLSACSFTMMESSSSENIHPLEQLAMITDGGGVRVAVSHNPAGQALNLEHGMEHFESSRDDRATGTGSADLISSALDAANICEADGASVHDQQAAAEEGIIYRNPQNNTPATASSKVHFISNLTLIAKQQQNASRAGPNIIFLNNAGAPATNNSSHSTGHKLTSAAAGTATTNYINAFVSKGVATTAGGKVVNVLHSAPKAATPLAQQVRGKATAPMLKRPPTQPPPRSLSVIGRSAGGKSHVTLQTQKPPHIVIGGTATSSSALSMKSLASGKLIAPGLYSSATVGGAAATMTTKVAYSVGGESQHHSVPKYGRGGLVQGKGLKAAVSKYQVPKVVQVQQLQRHSPHKSPSSLNYTQLRVDEPSLNVVHGHSPTKTATTALPSPQVVHKSSIQFPPAALSSNGEQGSRTPQGPRSTNSYVNMTAQAFGHFGEEYSTQGDAEGRATGTIKYVSAQGNVIQHVHSSIATTKPAVATQPPSEEVYFVNGTQMSDEMSARLLQNFSQKAARRYVAQLPAVTNPTTHHNSPVTGGGHKHQYLASPISAIGPEYVRVK